MKSIIPKENSDGKLPVFVFPTELKFYLEDQSSHKQVLTLYNPYEFTVLFKVLCNNPTKYNVVETEGFIKSKCCIDIVIRVLDFTQGLHREDKFRIHLYEHGLPTLLGKKDIVAFLCEKAEESKESPKLCKKPNVREVDEIFQQHRKASVVVQRSLPSIPVIILSLACIIALMLPLEGEDGFSTSIPKYLYLTINQKLIAAFILGLVTMAVLKP